MPKQINIDLIKKVSVKEKSFFSKQLSTMLGAGLQLSGAIRILKEQTRNHYFRQILSQILEDLEQGKKFSQSLARFPKVFNRVYVNIVFAGENSGKLDKVLEELAQQLAQESDFLSRMRNAMIYPVVILIFMIGVALFTSVKLIPSLEGIFKEAGQELPWATTMVIGFSHFLIDSWYWLILGIIIVVVLSVYAYKTPAGEIFCHRLILSEPLGLFKNIYLLRFTRTLGSLLISDVPIVEAINITSEVIGNDLYRDELRYFSGELEKGVPLSYSVSQSGLFPYFVSQMLMVGEKTGKSDKILLSLADYFHKESSYQIDNLTKIFEPVIIVLLGIGVGILVFAIIVPIYQFAQFMG
jgi:type IV pilus assembly protein PilC